MPASSDSHPLITKFTNCRLIRGDNLFEDNLWVRAGAIIDPELCFFDEKRKADITIDCEGLVIAPGFIDLQINGNICKPYPHRKWVIDPLFVFVLSLFLFSISYVWQVVSGTTFLIQSKHQILKKRWMSSPQELSNMVSPHSAPLSSPSHQTRTKRSFL